MEPKDLIIGSHVSMNEPNYLLGSVKEALSYGANTFMFYTGAPQNTIRKSISFFKVAEAKELMKENGIDINNVVVHAPYIINLANQDEEKYEFARNFLLEEVKRVDQIGCKYLVLHPGSHLGVGFKNVVNLVINALNDIIDKTNNVVILLETMAGKGNEIGKTFEEIADIIAGIHKKERIGVCLDTCHIHDGGYDLNQWDTVLNHFDEVVGLEQIKVVHINDSKNPIGAHKDRHENIGFGCIGYDLLLKVIYDERLAHTVKILETPYIEGNPPYKEEIKMIRERVFNPSLKEIVKGDR